jgi:antitoxin (DNA-binding transcriptional repressor) of toxin-antitoxin stability system
MTTISVHEIQRDPLGYLRRVEAGEALLVVRGDVPVAEIKPVAARSEQPRPFGLCAGEFSVPDDFDGPLPVSIRKLLPTTPPTPSPSPP